MKEKAMRIPAFLTGGDKMGELIRSFDWSKTAIGSPDTWPPSLRIAVRIMLDCPFGMYIAWGNEYIQLYNDGYRPILGASKHPEALGISTRKTFEEIWHTIGPMFDGVMEGTPVGFPDFILHLDRNGFVEECVFDFSYSPIRLEDGEVGGVLVTVIETTEKVNNLKKLAESNDQLNFAIEATELGTWEYNPLTNKFNGNNRLKDWFGLRNDADINLSQAIEVMVENDKSRVADAIQKALQYESGGLYDIEYGILNPITKQERIVRAKGRAWFGDDKTAYRFNGTLQDITQEAITKKKIEESEENLRRTILQAPVAMCIFKGENFIVDLANDRMFEFWGKAAKEVMHKPIFEGLPEAKEQGFEAILQGVYTTGKTYSADGVPINLPRNGTIEPVYVNFVYEPYREADGIVSGILAVAIDVTAQVTAHKKIEASEQRLSNERMVLYNSFMNAPAGIAILKGDTHIYEFANAEYEKLVDRKITPGKTVQEVFPEIEQQGLIDILNNVFLTGEPFIANEFPVELFNSKTGKNVLRYYTSVIQPMSDEKGNTERLLSHGMEVTQQVESRKLIEEANHQLRLAATLTENIADAVIATDMDYKTISWNKGAENLYGYASEELMGKYAMELLRTQFFSDEDKQAWPGALDATGKWQGEVVQSKKDGTLVSVLVSIAYVYDEKGKPIAAVTVNRDITERKKAEEKIIINEAKFRTLSETIPHMIWTATPDGKKNYFNQYFLDYTGLSFEELNGNGWQEIVFADDLKKELKQWDHTLKTGQDFIIEKRIRQHDGTYRWHLSHSIAQKDKQGNIIGWIGTNTDITEQKIFTEELEKKVKERTEELHEKNLALELTNAELNSFSYIASHDLKEPLRKIQAFSKRIIETENFSDKTQDYFNRIISAGERMQNLIDSLLDFSRANTTELIFEPCDLGRVVEESKSDLYESIVEKEAVIEAENLPTINGVCIQITQLITNLLDNAIKYSRPEVKPHIKITSSIIEGKTIEHPAANNQKEYHAITIADNGIGFEKQYEAKIFELFQRLHGRNEYSGTGIGLAIVKKIVSGHNGFIMVEGKPGIGSTFTIYIPIS
ncbi:MAG: PAS domain S-box protein [Ferruginibacter sp.]